MILEMCLLQGKLGGSAKVGGVLKLDTVAWFSTYSLNV